MKKDTLKDFFRGWFIGNFSPTLIKTNEVEIGVKRYKAGNSEAAHHHKIATEITVIISGEVEMNGVKYVEDDIIVIDPNDSTDFKCLTDVVTVVVKYPGANNDKYVD
jgi:mannose-6-phosphate isomerase-like protein (cupin superfamily)